MDRYNARWTLFHWNCDGLTKDKCEWLSSYIKSKSTIDVICLNETKSSIEVLDKLLQDSSLIKDYVLVSNIHAPSNIHGVCVLLRRDWSGCKNFEVLSFDMKCEPRHDTEKDYACSSGRVVALQLFTGTVYPIRLVSCYFPDSEKDPEYRVKQWDKAFSDTLSCIHEESTVCIGDFNTAHEAIDVSYPFDMLNKPGFSDEEHKNLDTLHSSGWVDTWRHVHGNREGYTWHSEDGGLEMRLDHCFAKFNDKELLKEIRITIDRECKAPSDHHPLFVVIPVKTVKEWGKSGLQGETGIEESQKSFAKCIQGEKLSGTKIKEISDEARALKEAYIGDTFQVAPKTQLETKKETITTSDLSFHMKLLEMDFSTFVSNYHSFAEKALLISNGKEASDIIRQMNVSLQAFAFKTGSSMNRISKYLNPKAESICIGQMHRAAGIIPYVKTEVSTLILLGFFSNKPKIPGTYQVLGGKGQEGEIPLDTAIREFWEETGYMVEKKKLNSLHDEPQLSSNIKGGKYTVFLVEATKLFDDWKTVPERFKVVNELSANALAWMDPKVKHKDLHVFCEQILNFKPVKKFLEPVQRKEIVVATLD